MEKKEKRKHTFLIHLISQCLWVYNILCCSIVCADILSGLPTLEHATYNCPCEKQSASISKPHNSKDRPWALLMVIANTNQIGNCNLLNWNGISVGIIGMRGMRTPSPLKGPVKIVASTTLLISFFTASRAPVRALTGWHLATWQLARWYSTAVRAVASLADRVNSKILLDN